MIRRIYILCAGVALALVLSGIAVRSATAESTYPGEYQVKAVFLYNFAKFIEWPQETSLPLGAPFTICILGKNPFDRATDAIVGKSVRNRRIVVRQITRPDEGSGCAMVFVSSSEQAKVRHIVDILEENSVLTISDLPRFVTSGGMIGFITLNDTVAFEINQGAAQRARLRISPQLLKLARTVVGR